jgi:hypothetical protein
MAAGARDIRSGEDKPRFFASHLYTRTIRPRQTERTRKRPCSGKRRLRMESDIPRTAPFPTSWETRLKALHFSFPTPFRGGNGKGGRRGDGNLEIIGHPKRARLRTPPRQAQKGQVGREIDLSQGYESIRPSHGKCCHLISRAICLEMRHNCLEFLLYIFLTSQTLCHYLCSTF